MSEVSSEAVEALAEQFEFYLVDTVDQPGTFAAKVTVEQIEGLARLALAAHQPARVVPSAEEVQAVVARVVAPYVSGPLDPLDVDVTNAVLALFASRPTVDEVREQVAQEIEQFRDARDPVFGPLTRGERYVVDVAVRIARGETKGGE